MTIATILDRKGRDIFSMAPDALMSDVVKVLREKQIGAVLIAQQEKLCGIISERDIVRALSSKGGAALMMPVSEFMTRDVITCSEADTIVAIMSKMTTGRFRHMPVLEEGKIVGLVSIGDVVKQRIAESEREAEDMRAYIAAG
ncbi:CBS domain-containing protein [uncultured Cohaesibacter sp.]|uniref:CBS domain-containing protein n=1 Tax=uncultured Cohaesibacter sp. TaxID=1002546 RepID=UPI00292D1F67|nr:CBS domain-containing protein [uncultured Cohaesibacter sp.]